MNNGERKSYGIKYTWFKRQGTVGSKGDIQLPQFERAAVTEATRENPCWIHFGAGNIFRAFQANVMQNILNRGEMETGLIVAEGFDYEIIEKMTVRMMIIPFLSH